MRQFFQHPLFEQNHMKMLTFKQKLCLLTTRGGEHTFYIFYKQGRQTFYVSNYEIIGYLSHRM